MESLIDAAPAPASGAASSGATTITPQKLSKETPTALLVDVSGSEAPPLRSILRSPQDFKPRAAPAPALDAAAAPAAAAGAEASTARSALTDDEGWKRMADTLPTPHTQSRIAGAEWETALGASLDSAGKGKQKAHSRPPSQDHPSPPGAMPVEAGASSSLQAYVEEVDEAKASSRAPSRAPSVKAASKSQPPPAKAAPPPKAAAATKAPSRAPSVSHRSQQSEIKGAPPPPPPAHVPAVSLAPPAAGTTAAQRRSTSASTQAAANYATSTTYPPSLSVVGGAASEFTGITMPDKPQDMPDDVYQALRREAQAQARRIVEDEMQRRGLAESEFTATGFTDAETYRTAARQSEPPLSHVEPAGPPIPVPPFNTAPAPPMESMPYPYDPQMGMPLPSPPQGYWSGAVPDWQDSEALVAAWREQWARSQEAPPDAAWAMPPPGVPEMDPRQTLDSSAGLGGGGTYDAMPPPTAYDMPPQQPPPPPVPVPYPTWEPSQPSPQAIMTASEWYMRNGGGELPPGWVAEYDERYGAWYFVDQSVYPPRSTWHDPRLGSPRERFSNSRRRSNSTSSRRGERRTMPGAYEAWADGWAEEESVLHAARQFEAYEASKLARGHRGPVAAEMDREREAARRARRIYEEASEAPLRLVEAARRDDVGGIVKAEEMAARAAGARDRMRGDDALRAAAIPVGLQGYEGPSRGWDVWGRPREAWMSAPGPDGGRPGFAAPPTYAPHVLAAGAPPLMQPDGQWNPAAARMGRGRAVLDWRFARAHARPRVGMKGSHTPTPFGLPEAVFSMDMALRAAHATEALEGVYLGSAPYPGPPAAPFPPNNSQRRALANAPYNA